MPIAVMMTDAPVGNERRIRPGRQKVAMAAPMSRPIECESVPK